MPEIEIHSLDNHGNPKSRRVFLMLIFITAALAFVMYGFYRLYTWSENRKALEEKNRIARQQQAPQISVTLIEGWTIEEIFSALEKKSLIDKKQALEELKKVSDENNFIRSNVGNSISSYEGFLFPDTYKFFK